MHQKNLRNTAACFLASIALISAAAAQQPSRFRLADLAGPGSEGLERADVAEALEIEPDCRYPFVRE